MAENLVDMLQIALSRTFSGELANHLGESGTTTRSALGAAVPALLAGLLQQGATPAGAAELQRRVTDPQIDLGLTGNIGSWLDGGPKMAGLLSQGSGLLSWLFGSRTGAVAEAVGSVSGMTIASASTLLSLTAPAVFALLKRYLSQNRLDAGGLPGLLAGQRDALRVQLDNRVGEALGVATPAALLAGLASGVSKPAAAAAGSGAGTARDVAPRARQRAEAAYATAGRRPAPVVPVTRRPRFWGALAAAAVALILFFSYWTVPVEQTAQTAQNLASTVSRVVKSLDLPGGMKIDVTAGGFVDTLTTFLNTKDVTLNRSFTFDELQFDPGSATLSPVSHLQLEQLAAVLKAYRTVLVSVAGHTDNAGDAAANLRLSAQRAAAVKEALVGEGVAATRVTDEGYGSERPIASNDTEDGRARNRRVELVVLKR
jgi:outer membrane protein OmpA-like peptidoglycan-associated protein